MSFIKKYLVGIAFMMAFSILKASAHEPLISSFDMEVEEVLVERGRVSWNQELVVYPSKEGKCDKKRFCSRDDGYVRLTCKKGQHIKAGEKIGWFSFNDFDPGEGQSLDEEEEFLLRGETKGASQVLSLLTFHSASEQSHMSLESPLKGQETPWAIFLSVGPEFYPETLNEAKKGTKIPTFMDGDGVMTRPFLSGRAGELFPVQEQVFYYVQREPSLQLHQPLVQDELTKVPATPIFRSYASSPETKTLIEGTLSEQLIYFLLEMLITVMAWAFFHEEKKRFLSFIVPSFRSLKARTNLIIERVIWSLDLKRRTLSLERKARSRRARSIGL